MAQKVASCTRCGRKLTDPLSIDRGYGPTCWDKEGRFITQQVNVEHLHVLEAKISRLEKQLAALHAIPVNGSPQIPMPAPNGNGGSKAKIPLMVGGWDVSELQGNPLFMQMQAVCEAPA